MSWKLPKTLLVLLGIVIFFPLEAAVQVQGQDPKDKISDQTVAVADQRKSLIRQEITLLGEHGWAGEYHFGDGLGANVTLTLAPASGFVFTWFGCLGLYDVNYGAVRFEDGRLKLTFEQPNQRGDFHGIAPEFYPVRWGDRHYLIPPEEVIGFCNAVNSGIEPCDDFCARFLLRRGDQEKGVAGVPSIPTQFRQYLVDQPIHSKIIKVEHRYIQKDKDDPDLKFRISLVILDVGQAEGMLPGMEMHCSEPSQAEIAEVIGVEEHNCRARIVEIGTDGEKPRVGWRLSTCLIEKVLSQTSKIKHNHAMHADLLQRRSSVHWRNGRRFANR